MPDFDLSPAAAVDLQRGLVSRMIRTRDARPVRTPPALPNRPFHTYCIGMIKKKIYGDTLKEQLLASARDRSYRFVLRGGSVRAVMVNGTRMINEMRANHELGILETLVLGRGYLGAILMAGNLKGQDRVRIQIDCSGPIQGLSVEANARGEVRGYLKNDAIPVEQPLESFDLSRFFGAGLLSVTRHLEDVKQPFTGKVALQYGNLAKDLAYYYLTSEQIPAAFNLSIQYDPQGEVIGAGGLLLQILPEVRESVVYDLESLVHNLPSLGMEFSRGRDAQEIIQSVFADHRPRILDDRRIEFFCRCNKDRVHNILMMLPLDELQDLAENGPFPVELRCHHCSSRYLFDQEEVRRIYGLRYSDN